MADEATVRSYLRIQLGEIALPPYSVAFTADVSSLGGPTPGTITVTEDGVDISLTQLTNPGLCFIHNLSELYSARLGLWDVDQSVFKPLFLFLPGEGYVVRLDTLVEEEFAGTGSGTSGAANRLRLKSTGGNIKVLVAAHET